MAAASPNTKHSSRLFDAKRLAPCKPDEVASPAAHSHAAFAGRRALAADHRAGPNGELSTAAIEEALRDATRAWVLIAVFHWSVHRPALMPVQAAFVIGLLQDLLLGSPLGIGALIYVLVRGSAGWMGRLAAGRGFVGLWLVFALAAAAAFVLRYVIMVAWHGQLIAPIPALLQWLVTVGVYPLVAWVFIRLQKGLLSHA